MDKTHEPVLDVNPQETNDNVPQLEILNQLVDEFFTQVDQITQHKCAGPFLHPVDVVGLGLHDYYKVIEKPMNFSTIKNKMKARDGTAYKNVREICADVRLIFKNAMKYNKEKDDVHVMAKTLLDKFETKWLQLSTKVDEELDEIDTQLVELNEMVLQMCRVNTPCGN